MAALKKASASEASSRPAPSSARSTAGNSHEGFGGQVPQMQGAAEQVREGIRNTRPSARRRRRRRWGAWAPKHRGGFSAGLLGARPLSPARAADNGHGRISPEPLVMS